MHNKIIKFWFYSLSLIVLASFTFAQTGDIGGESDGLIPLFLDLLGLGDLGLGSDPYNTIGFFAALAVLTITFYFILETAARKVDSDELNEALSLGRTDSGMSKRLLGFSSLLVLTSMGLSAQFLEIVWSIQALIGIGIISMVILGILYIFAGSLIFTGGAMKASASGVRYGTEGITEIKNSMSEAREELSRAEREEGRVQEEAQDAAQTGDDEELRESMKILLQAAEDIAHAEEHIETIDELGEEEIVHIKNEAKQAIQREQQEIEILSAVEKDFEDFYDQFHTIRTGIENGKSFNSDVRPMFESPSLLNHPQDLRNYIERLSEGEKIEKSAVGQEVREALELAEAWREVQTLEKELPDAVKTAAKEDNFIEQVAEKLGDPEIVDLAEREKEKINKLEEHVKVIMNMESEVEHELNQLEKMIEQEVRDEEEIIKELRKIEEQINDLIVPEIEGMKNKLQSYYHDSIRIEHDGKEVYPVVYLDNLEDMLSQFSRTLEKVERETQQEEEMLSSAARRLSELF